MLSFLSRLQRLFCFHGSRRPQGSQTDFSEIADTILRPRNSPAFPALLPAGPDRGCTADIPHRAVRKTDKSA